ncbi:hypothetical protein [Spongiactinospora sp. TRM90649]|uniref:hypothetical protein n=1 Tax=Spongiactinospora sp. TRM90649 TaxID=3031114 RepID=UPI0023FA276F|nr:hypothetical protein [Spongiactinospora sp. TRM90649]MDF5756219.1 hypothetical protein [Spongiactinospora sp. TRM90649]
MSVSTDSRQTLSTQPTKTSPVRPTGLSAVLSEVAEKRAADLIRFRTCCADPRASK